jgi:hypothetical protein
MTMKIIGTGTFLSENFAVRTSSRAAYQSSDSTLSKDSMPVEFTRGGEALEGTLNTMMDGW